MDRQPCLSTRHVVCLVRGLPHLACLFDTVGSGGLLREWPCIAWKLEPAAAVAEVIKRGQLAFFLECQALKLLVCMATWRVLAGPPSSSKGPRG